MKKTWKEAELIETNICETADTGYCGGRNVSAVNEESGQNTKDCNKCPSWWHWDELCNWHLHF